MVRSHKVSRGKLCGSDSTNGVVTEKENKMKCERNEIKIKLSSRNYWISIVEVDGDYQIKELALVTKSATDFLGVRLVKLNDWFDSALHDCECTVNLLGNVRYHMLLDADEWQIVSEAILRAEKYLSRFRGFEIVSDFSVED